MKRILLACLGMLLLGTAGVIVIHSVLDSPPALQAQPEFGQPPMPGGGGQPGQPGQFKDLVPPLLESLADADGGVRQLAAATLVKIGPDSTKPLVEALKSREKELRANAAYVLGQLGESAQEALPALAKALKDEDKEVRRRAAFALHNIVAHSDSGSGGPGGFSGGGPGGGPRPGPAGGLSVTGSLSPLDPGLLVPAMPMPTRIEKAPQ